jgi:hypothetical protein
MKLDDLVGKGLRDAAAQARFEETAWVSPTEPDGVPGPQRGRGRRWAVAALAAAVVIAAVALPLVLLAPLGEEKERPGASSATDPGEGVQDDETHTDVNDGLSVTIPEAWTFHQDPSGPVDPKSVFGVGTWTFPKGGDCAPTAAQAELPADGAFFFLYEYLGGGDPADFPPRPSHFQLDTSTLGHYECQVVPSYMIRFRDAGRLFQVHVAFGPQAYESLRPEVLRALDSIEVTAPVPDACPADTGPWSDPNCPLPGWTRAVVEEAGYEVTGNTGSAVVAEGLGGEFNIWAFPKDFTVEHLLQEENYREAMIVDDVVVYSDGVRMVWVTQGLAVWVAGWEIGEPPPGEPPPTPIVADLASASKRVDYDSIDTR